MAENTQDMNKQPTGTGEGGSAPEHKRRRGHRGGRNHKRHRENAPATEQASAPAANAPAADAASAVIDETTPAAA